MKQLSLLITLLILFCLNDSGLCQRIVSSTPTTNGCYRQTVTPITQALTLHSDMSLNTMIGYIYFDSLCRSLTSNFQIDSFASQIASLDTLKPFLKYSYAMIDYDASLFDEYLNNAHFLNSAYNVIPGVVFRVLQGREKAILGVASKKARLTNTALILHVRITNVSNDVDSFATFGSKKLPLKCITATVLDTIKGKHFRACGSWLESNNQNPFPTSTNPCINFSFSPVWEKENLGTDNLTLTSDSLGNLVFPCQNCFGDTTVTQDSEYIVFLDNMYLDYNGTNAFYNYWPNNGYSSEGGIFKITSGYVADPSNFFGRGTSVTLNDFESGLKSDINDILTLH